MKTFTCVICGEQVSKRKSLAYQGGRACRKHEEVVNNINNDKAEKEIQSLIASIEVFYKNAEWVHISDGGYLSYVCNCGGDIIPLVSVMWSEIEHLPKPNQTIYLNEMIRRSKEVLIKQKTQEVRDKYEMYSELNTTN